MNSIIIPCSPKECEQIANGDMTVLVRKIAPKEVPFKAYIYMTKAKPYWLKFVGNGIMEARNGKVIGEFVCDKVEECIPDYNPVIQEFFYNEWEDSEATCLTAEEQSKYGKSKPLYGWHISELKIYDEPRELSEFNKYIKGLVDLNHCDNKCSLCQSDLSCNRAVRRPPATYCYVEED